METSGKIVTITSQLKDDAYDPYLAGLSEGSRTAYLAAKRSDVEMDHMAKCVAGLVKPDRTIFWHQLESRYPPLDPVLPWIAQRFEWVNIENGLANASKLHAKMIKKFNPSIRNDNYWQAASDAEHFVRELKDKFADKDNLANYLQDCALEIQIPKVEVVRTYFEDAMLSKAMEDAHFKARADAYFKSIDIVAAIATIPKSRGAVGAKAAKAAAAKIRMELLSFCCELQ